MNSNKNFIYHSIGRNIKSLRKKNNLGQEELSQLISLSRPSISNIEAGKQQPSIQTIFDIALAFNCELNDILPSVIDFQKSSKPIDEKFENYLNSLNDISLKNLNILKEYLKDE